MGSRRIRARDLPHGAVLETWSDNTCWIVLPNGDRVTLRDHVETADHPDPRYAG